MGTSSEGSRAGPASDKRADYESGDVERPEFHSDLREQTERETAVFEESPDPVERLAAALPAQ